MHLCADCNAVGSFPCLARKERIPIDHTLCSFFNAPSLYGLQTAFGAPGDSDTNSSDSHMCCLVVWNDPGQHRAAAVSSAANGAQKQLPHLIKMTSSCLPQMLTSSRLLFSLQPTLFFTMKRSPSHPHRGKYWAYKDESPPGEMQ